MRRISLILLSLVALGVLASGLFHSRREKAVEATTASPAIAVDLTEPKRETLQRTVEVYGSLSPKTATEVKNELPGRVMKMRVKEWDRVKPNDVLLEMDPTDFNLVLSRSETGLNMAKAQLLQAKVDLNRARREWNRAVKLKEGGLITGQDLDERQTSLESAEARVALAQAQVGQAEVQMAEARRGLHKTVLSAPIDGVVSQRKVDVGDWIDKGTLLFTIVDNRIMDFTANVPATDLALVTEGQTLAFTVDGLSNQSFHGRIKRINPVVSHSDRTGKLLAEVENENGTLKGGLFARGKVLVEERKDAVVLPKAALVNWNLEKASASVFVVDGAGTARSKTVSTGLENDRMVEIRAGLSGTERIVLRGGFNLKEGDRVQDAAAARESDKK